MFSEYLGSGMNTHGFERAIRANWLRLVAQEPGPPPAPGQSAGPEGLDTDTQDRRPLVLLVEDNQINQVVALEFLALMGVESLLASNGQEALSACHQATPDLVLMDIQMPGMDGLECTRRLRQLQSSGRLPHFPILALTAHALESDIAASLAAGMDEHLTKPLDFSALRSRLGRWLVLPGLAS